MDNTLVMAILEIRKKSTATWVHVKDSVEIIISSGHFRIDNNYFELTEPHGVDQFYRENRTTLSEIRLYDETDAGTEETFGTWQGLVDRLYALNYPFFKASSTGGDGTWGSITGTITNQTDLVNYINDELGSSESGSQLYEGRYGYYNVSGYQWYAFIDLYKINGVTYSNFIEATLNLAAADPTNDRFDLIVVNNNETISVITGTASADPTIPNINSDTQVLMTVIRVTANTTSPVGLNVLDVYDENLQVAGGEFDTSGDASVDFANTEQVNNGSVSTKFDNASNGDEAVYTDSTLHLGSSFSLIKYRIFIGSVSNYKFRISLSNNTNDSSVEVQNGLYGFREDVINTWQTVIIPQSEFSGLAAIDYDTVTITNLRNNSTFFLEEIEIQEGLAPIGGAIPDYLLNLDGSDLELLKDGLLHSTVDLSGLGGGIPTETEAYTSTIKTDKQYFSTISDRHTQTGQISFVSNLTNAIINGGGIKEIESNGEPWIFDTNFGSIASGLPLTDNNVIPDDGITYRVIFFYNGSKIDVSIAEMEDIVFVPTLTAPTLSTVVPGSSFGELDVTFTDPNSSPNETGTLVYYRETLVGGAWTYFGKTAADATSETITGLSLNTQYDVSLIADGLQGTANSSPRSNIVAGTTDNIDYTTDLVASYNFNTDASDYTTNHDGTEFNTPSHPSAKVNNGIEFNGSTQYVTIPDHDDFSFTDGAGTDTSFSISFWMNTDSLSGVRDLIIKRDLGSNNEWQINFNGNVLQWRLFNNGATSDYIENTFDVNSLASVGSGTWHHFVLTYDGSELDSGMNVYIDKTLYTSGQNTVGTYNGMSNGTRPVYIARRDGGANYWDGKLDELHIWKNRVLSQVEVDNMFDVEDAGGSIL